MCTMENIVAEADSATLIMPRRSKEGGRGNRLRTRMLWRSGMVRHDYIAPYVVAVNGLMVDVLAKLYF